MYELKIQLINTPADERRAFLSQLDADTLRELSKEFANGGNTYGLKTLIDSETIARLKRSGLSLSPNGAKGPGDAERELPERFVIGGRAVEGYQDLADILTFAYRQSAEGKGKDRHASTGKPFDRQPIMEIARMTQGIDFHVGQAMKKAQEASTMVQRGEHDRARAELLGVIVYAAAAFKRATELKAQAESGTT